MSPQTVYLDIIFHLRSAVEKQWEVIVFDGDTEKGYTDRHSYHSSHNSYGYLEHCQATVPQYGKHLCLTLNISHVYNMLSLVTL